MLSNSRRPDFDDLKALALFIAALPALFALAGFLMFVGALWLAAASVDKIWLLMLRIARPEAYWRAKQERADERERFFNSSAWDPIYQPMGSSRR